MKKFIQVFLFLGLALIFGGISAQAQSVTKIEAKIPFDFVVGDKAFAAGDYVLRISPTATSARELEIRNAAGEIVYTAFAVINGDTGKGRLELVFDRVNGQKTLAKILTDSKGFSVRYGDANRHIAAKKPSADKTTN